MTVRELFFFSLLVFVFVFLVESCPQVEHRGRESEGKRRLRPLDGDTFIPLLVEDARTSPKGGRRGREKRGGGERDFQKGEEEKAEREEKKGGHPENRHSINIASTWDYNHPRYGERHRFNAIKIMLAAKRVMCVTKSCRRADSETPRDEH